MSASSAAGSPGSRRRANCARSGWSVVLIEAGRLAANASGRNTGFVLPGFAADADKLIARVGFARTKDLWALAQAGARLCPRCRSRADGMAGIDPQDGWLYVSKTDNSDELLSMSRCSASSAARSRAGRPSACARCCAANATSTPSIICARFTIHPLNYALALAAAAERDGARIFENTPALSIDPAGVRKRIVTPDARLRANHVVLCGNVQIGALMPQLGGDADTDHDLCDHHRAARRSARRSRRLSRRRQRQRCSPTITTASSAATG